MIALALLAVVGWLYGGVIVRIITDTGELIVEVNDPNIEVTVKQGGAEVVDKTKNRRFVLAAKDGEVVFHDPETGARAMTKQFRLTRGGTDRVIATTAEIAAAKLPGTKVAPPKVAATSFSAAQKKDFAEILRRQHTLYVRQGNTRLTFRSADIERVLSTDDYAITGVRLNGDTKVVPLEDLALLESLPATATHVRLQHMLVNKQYLESMTRLRWFKNLDSFQFIGGNWTDEDVIAMPIAGRLKQIELSNAGGLSERTLQHLRSAPLEWISLEEAPGVTGAFLSDEGRFPMLNFLQIGRSMPKFDEQYLRHLKDFPKLEKVRLQNPQVTDASLESILACKNLVEINLVGSKITSAGGARLRAAFPNADLRLSEPLAPRTPAPAPLTAAQRKCIDDLIAKGQTIALNVNNERVLVGLAHPEKSLPSGSVEVVEVHIYSYRQKKSFSDADSTLLANLPPTVTVLILNASDVTSQGFESISRMPWFNNLEKFTISSSPSWTDACMAPIATLPKLKQIVATNLAQATDESLERLRAKSLEYINLDLVPKVTGSFLSQDGPWRQSLTRLNIGRGCSRFDEQFLSNLKHFPKLTDVGFNGNLAVTDASIDHLIACKTLKNINLTRTKVTAAGAKRLMTAFPTASIVMPETVVPNPPSTPTLFTDEQRQAAEYVLANKGEILFFDGVQNVHLKSGDPLPEQPLEILELRGAPVPINDAAMETLRHLPPVLNVLHLCGPAVKDKTLERWASIPGARAARAVYLIDSGVTDAGLVLLKDFPRLGEVNLMRTGVTGEGLVHLKGKSIVTIQLGECKNVTNAAMDHLAAIPTLRAVHLHATAVTAEGIRKLAPLKKLWFLNVGGPETPLSDDVAEALGPLTHLRLVGIHGRGFGDAGVAKTPELPRLELLSVSGSSISDAGLKIIAGRKSIAEVAVHSDKVTQAGIDALVAVRPDLRIEWNGPTAEPRCVQGSHEWKSLEWILANGGGMALDHGTFDNHDMVDLKPGAALPTKKFTLHSLVTAEMKLKADAATRRVFQNLPPLRQNFQISGPGGAMTDELLEMYSTCKPLLRATDIYLQHSAVSDAGLAHLLPFQARWVNLERNGKITDAGIEHLIACDCLTSVNLRGTKVTRAAVARLALAHPFCAIQWDGTLTELAIAAGIPE